MRWLGGPQHKQKANEQQEASYPCGERDTRVAIAPARIALLAIDSVEVPHCTVEATMERSEWIVASVFADDSH
jgi:hypothetical protein